MSGQRLVDILAAILIAIVILAAIVGCARPPAAAQRCPDPPPSIYTRPPADRYEFTCRS